MANICRLCGNNEDQTIFIFGNEALKHHIDLKIRVGLDIQIFPNDPLPKYACVWCLGKLDEFWTFQHHCRRVQTNLRRLLPERVPFTFQNISCDQHQNSMTNTEEFSAHIEVFVPVVAFTENDVNNRGDLNSINDGKVNVNKVKLETHSHENSNDSIHSYNESHGKEGSWSNDPLIEPDLLVATQNETSLAAGRLDSYYQDSEENMAFSAVELTSETAPGNNPVTVAGESEGLDNPVCEEPDTINTVLGRGGTALSVNNKSLNYHSLCDGPQYPLLTEEQTWEVPNTVLSTTSILKVAEKGSEDKRSSDSFSFNDLNPNSLQVQDMIPGTSHYLTTANKGHHGNQSTDTCSFLDNNTQVSLLMEAHPSKNRNDGTDGTTDISTVVVNNGKNIAYEVDCHSAFNTLQHFLLKGEVACKATSLATDIGSRNISLHEVHDGEVTQRDGFDSSQPSVIITDLPLNHANLVESGVTNVSAGIEAAQNVASSDYNPQYLLGEVCNTGPQVTGKLTRSTEYDFNGHSIKGYSHPLEVMLSATDIVDMSDQNMVTSEKVSDFIDSVAVTIENNVHQTLDTNTASRSDSNMNYESKEHENIVNSGNSAACVHGIDASMCVYKNCCESHQFDKYWNKEDGLFHCSLCVFVTVRTNKIREHISSHLSLKLFECSICCKKFDLFKNLSFHIKVHKMKDAGMGVKECDEFSCENCPKIFKSRSSLHDHRIHKCGIGSFSCPDCGLLISSLEKHKFRCPGNTGFVCDICNKSYKVKKNLIQHLQTHDQGEYACDKCEKMYSTPMSLYQHQKNKHDTPKFKCTYCPSSFYFKSLFENHLVTHIETRNNGDRQPLEVIHSDADIAVIPDQNMETCGKVSDLIDSVAVTSENEVHQSLQINTGSRSDSNTGRETKDQSTIVNSENSATCVHGIDPNMCMNIQCCVSHPFDKNWKKLRSCFCCMLCKFVTDGVTLIRRHISSHVSLKMYECSICYTKLRSYKNLTLHMKRHSRKHDGSSTKECGVYTCVNCSETFNGKANLRRHEIKTCMIGSSSCPDCGLRFSALKKHRLRCPGKTGFICAICNKSVNQKDKLIKHLRTHEQGEFACDKCEKIFSKSHLLRNHQNAEHGTGKFKCTYCTKTFCNNQRLEAHVVSHTGIRNYLCEICSKRFLNQGNLVTHMKFHGKKDIKCQFCDKVYFRKNMLLSHMNNVHCK